MGRYIATGITASFVTDAIELIEFEILDIDDSGEEAEQVEVTSQGSTDGYKEFLSGNIDGGEVSIDCLYDPTVSNRPAAGDSGTLEIDYPGSTTGRIATVNVKKANNIDAKLGARVGVKLVFKVTGKPTDAT